MKLNIALNLANKILYEGAELTNTIYRIMNIRELYNILVELKWDGESPSLEYIIPGKKGRRPTSTNKGILPTNAKKYDSYKSMSRTITPDTINTYFDPFTSVIVEFNVNKLKKLNNASVQPIKYNQDNYMSKPAIKRLRILVLKKQRNELTPAEEKELSMLQAEKSNIDNVEERFYYNKTTNFSAKNEDNKLNIDKLLDCILAVYIAPAIGMVDNPTEAAELDKYVQTIVRLLSNKIVMLPDYYDEWEEAKEFGDEIPFEQFYARDINRHALTNMRNQDKKGRFSERLIR